MNLYTAERLLLERHEAMVRDAELRARLALTRGNPRWAVRLAAGLRAAADALDGAPDEAVRPVVVRSIHRPAP